jgi:hypothetical protein
MGTESASRIRCDDCNHIIDTGEVYYEVLTARRVAGDPPPMYAAKRVMCESCDRDHGDGCPCVGTPDQEDCPHA